ncbi:MAG TPA: DUF5335 family protein [Micropepsaceae bacterium]
MAQALDKSQWAHYCDRLSDVLESSNAEIEVASLDLGNQIEAEWLPFHGITYDDKDDIIDIELEGLDHIINHPQALRIDEDFAGLTTLEIKDGDGIQHVVRLKEALALPRQ